MNLSSVIDKRKALTVLMPAALFVLYLSVRCHGQTVAPIQLFCRPELALLLKVLARSVQFLGLLGALTMILGSWPALKSGSRQAILPLCQAGIIGGIATAMPELAKIAIPRLLGISL